MKTLVLADSSFCIAAGREFGDPFELFTLHHQGYEFATCGMVTVEVLRGLAVTKTLERWKQEFARLIYLPTKRTTWNIAHDISWKLERAGRRLSTPDIVIAACAIEADATVLTRDKRFWEIPNLKVIASL